MLDKLLKMRSTKHPLGGRLPKTRRPLDPSAVSARRWEGSRPLEPSENTPGLPDRPRSFAVAEVHKTLTLPIKKPPARPRPRSGPRPPPPPPVGGPVPPPLARPIPPRRRPLAGVVAPRAVIVGQTSRVALGQRRALALGHHVVVVADGRARALGGAVPRGRRRRHRAHRRWRLIRCGRLLRLSGPLRLALTPRCGQALVARVREGARRAPPTEALVLQVEAGLPFGLLADLR